MKSITYDRVILTVIAVLLYFNLTKQPIIIDRASSVPVRQDMPIKVDITGVHLGYSSNPLPVTISDQKVDIHLKSVDEHAFYRVKPIETTGSVSCSNCR